MKKLNQIVLGLLTGSALMAACSDAPSLAEPFEEQSQERPFFSVAPAPGFDIMSRTAPLAHDVVATQKIDGDGGGIRLWDAGIHIRFPKDALSHPTEITVKAFAGDRVAFEFAPHGLHFNVPIEIHIDAAGTEAEHLLKQYGYLSQTILLADYLGVYWEGDPIAGGVDPLENFPVFFRNGRLFFLTNHFSGYALAM